MKYMVILHPFSETGCVRTYNIPRLLARGARARRSLRAGDIVFFAAPHCVPGRASPFRAVQDGIDLATGGRCIYRAG